AEGEPGARGYPDRRGVAGGGAVAGCRRAAWRLPGCSLGRRRLEPPDRVGVPGQALARREEQELAGHAQVNAQGPPRLAANQQPLAAAIEGGDPVALEQVGPADAGRRCERAGSVLRRALA